MAQDELDQRLQQLDASELIALLRDVEMFQNDEVSLALVEALRKKEFPIASLRMAQQALVKWAGQDKEKLLYALEIDDITRRVAADLATAG